MGGLVVTARERQRMRVLGTICAACYVVGYPLAIWGDSGWGWVLVWVGGLFLIALGVIVVRVMTRAADDSGQSSLHDSAHDSTRESTPPAESAPPAEATPPAETTPPSGSTPAPGGDG